VHVLWQRTIRDSSSPEGVHHKCSSLADEEAEEIIGSCDAIRSNMQ
jgi:hypothetical protein